LLAKYLKSAAIYAFYVGVFQIVAVVLIPFGVHFLPLNYLWVSFVVGALFMGAVFIMYKGFLRGETTRVATLIGGSLPIYTFILSYLFLSERLASNQLIAFLFLAIGIVVISFEGFKKAKKPYVLLALFSGLLFSATFVLSKFVFNNVGFVSGFFWMRIGSALTAIAFLAYPVWRKFILEDLKQPKKEQAKSKGLLVGNQIIGATGFILLNYAISLGSVTLTNAMQGLQYVFIFIISLILGHWIKEIKEKVNFKIIAQKTVAIGFIVVGLIFLAL